MNTNRDAANPANLAKAVSVWMGTEPGDDEADIILETTLLCEGVMNPADVIESIESDDPEFIVITFDNMVAIKISCVTGAVAAIE